MRTNRLQHWSLWDVPNSGRYLESESSKGASFFKEQRRESLHELILRRHVIFEFRTAVKFCGSSFEKQRRRRRLLGADPCAVAHLGGDGPENRRLRSGRATAFVYPFRADFRGGLVVEPPQEFPSLTLLENSIRRCSTYFSRYQSIPPIWT